MPRSASWVIALTKIPSASTAFAEQSDPCAGVSCSGRGTCLVIRGEPGCACEEGFVADASAIIGGGVGLVGMVLSIIGGGIARRDHRRNQSRNSPTGTWTLLAAPTGDGGGVFGFTGSF